MGKPGLEEIRAFWAQAKEGVEVCNGIAITAARGEGRRHRFASRFGRSDIAILAMVDEAHETLSGPATKQILRREFEEYGRTEYESLPTISVAHFITCARAGLPAEMAVDRTD